MASTPWAVMRRPASAINRNFASGGSDDPRTSNRNSTAVATVSRDGVNWGKPIATGQGQMAITTIVFPTQNAHFIRITQTGSDPTCNWSIYEVDVYRKRAQ